MRMPDVNVLIYAHRRDAHADHVAYAAWLTALATGREPFALAPSILAGLVRIVTNPRVFARPSTLDEAFGFLHGLLRMPMARVVGPGPSHIALFEELCRASTARGKLVADAAHAAVALEHGCVFVTTDADFSRFPGLRWEHPLGPATR